VTEGALPRAASALSVTERAARALGQLASAVLGLLLLPVARGSTWAELLGVGWAEAVAAHAWLGRGFMVAVAAHVLCWWLVYAEQVSIFSENILVGAVRH
jgi:hypothetical protein